ncbi:MAG: 50S ribosomal protein L5 [Planctomycetia bacterium]|nr:50S ribosomal protein L5 [Planctomycetia bacterium]
MAKEKKEPQEKPEKPEKPGKPDKPAKAKEKEKEPAGPREKVVPRLLVRYQDLLPQLGKKVGRDNRLAVPRIDKIVVSMGVGTATGEKKHLEESVQAMAVIAGQKPLVTRAKKSVSGFRLREGMPIGCKATLRGARMYEFLDRLISIALPRVRDFRGLDPSAFDGHGNYNLGLAEQLVFPELHPDKFQRPQGLNVTIVMTGGSDDHSRELLTGLGMPFRAKGALDDEPEEEEKKPSAAKTPKPKPPKAAAKAAPKAAAPTA